MFRTIIVKAVVIGLKLNLKESAYPITSAKQVLSANVTVVGLIPGAK